MEKAYLIVNFGGPRHQEEIFPFLRELLTDRDVIRTKWPDFFHKLFFSWVAKKRAAQVADDYQLIGGGSPIFVDTEEIANRLSRNLRAPVFAFHRYLPDTHDEFIHKVETLEAREIAVFPMFPQFSYATTGSIARWFYRHLKRKNVESLRWCQSYPTHPAFVQATQKLIRDFLQRENLAHSDVFFIFSAHGLPQSFIQTGDPYATECENSRAAVAEGFPEIPSILSYQSKFGKGEWIRPYTEEVATSILQYHGGRPVIVIIPISFTSDHIETLFEIEHLYLPMIRRAGLRAYRCPALGLNADWIEAIGSIMRDPMHTQTHSLIRR